MDKRAEEELKRKFGLWINSKIDEQRAARKRVLDVTRKTNVISFVVSP